MSVSGFRYPANCPHCGECVEKYRPEDVRMAEEPTIQMGEYDPHNDAMTCETETWYKASPCGCTFPPEEHASFQKI